ncbi:MAG: hypothetical protein HY060_00275 [Proteobacteria bacterium]|nr:hypothetical protein [Pseudomonadota bacterium]
MEIWIMGLFALAVLALGWQGVKALNDLRNQIVGMKNAVEGIGKALEQQHTETRRTLTAIAQSVDNTAASLGRIESAMPSPPVRRVR